MASPWVEAPLRLIILQRLSATTIQAIYPLRKSHLMDNTLVRGHGG